MTAPAFSSGLYRGIVTHRRRRPCTHALRYRMLAMLFDLDELPALHRGLRLFAHNRFNLLSFHDRDHGPGRDAPLRPWIAARLAEAGIAADGPVRLLCSPRVLGQVFNPITVWFCHAADGALAAVLYEVNNTFGQRHSYLLPVDPAGRDAPVLRQSCAKQFYVSPFMDMAMTYRFRVTRPGNSMSLCIHADDRDGTVLTAGFIARRTEMTDMRILGAVARDPAHAAKVVGGIHWEALRLWRKGMRLRPRPAPPAQPVTITHLAHPATITHPGLPVATPPGGAA